MFDHTHFEALGHLSLLPLSSPQSSISFGGREELTPIFHFHLPPRSVIFQKLQILNILNDSIEIRTAIHTSGSPDC
jgi:hypothetical protein